VAVEEALQLAVEAGEAGPGGERLAGQFLDQARAHALGRDGDGLLGGGGERTLDQGFDLGQAAGGLEVADQALFAGGPQLGRGDEPSQEHERPLGGQVEGPLQAREDADQEIVQAREPLGLRRDQIATTTDQQAQLEVELAGRLDRTQVLTDAHLLGDHPNVAGVGLVLAADGALTGAVDRQPRHVDEREAGVGQVG